MVTKEMGALENDFTETNNYGVKPALSHESVLPAKFPKIPDSRLQKGVLYERITNIFITIGIPVNVKGYHFLREAIQLTLNEFDMLNCVMKKLYPMVASRFNTKSYIVERCIRHAIEIACNRGKMMNLNKIFGIGIIERNDKPTNSELIALLVEKLYLENNSCFGATR